MKFEAGKWYLADYRGHPHYLKCKDFTDVKFAYSEFVSNKIYFPFSGSSGIHKMGETILITNLSEIQKYLPEGHPDLKEINYEIF